MSDINSEGKSSSKKGSRDHSLIKSVISEQFDLKISSSGLPSSAKKEKPETPVHMTYSPSDGSLPHNTQSLDVQTEGAVDVEPSGSLMLGNQGTLQGAVDETHNQVATEWDNVDVENIGEPVYDENAVDAGDSSLPEELKLDKFVMKNGCCRECMKAFSKSGKVSDILICADGVI